MSLFGARRHPRTAAMPVEGHLPGFDGATGWLNSLPLTPTELRGRVVLVDFWTYTCINWLRTLPDASRVNTRSNSLWASAQARKLNSPRSTDRDSAGFDTESLSAPSPQLHDGKWSYETERKQDG